MRGKVISGATAVLILAFFFLPWVSVSYNGRVLGQFSGYQLAVGAGEYALDGLNGRSVLFLIPLAALVILLWGVIATFKQAWQTFSAVGVFVAALLGLLVLVFQLLGRGENPAIAFAMELGLWLTLLCFVSVMVGSVLILRETRQSRLTQVQVKQMVAPIQEDTGETAVSPLQPSPLDKLTQQDEASADTDVWQTWLVVTEGQNVGARFQIVPPFRIGRDPGNDIVVDDSSMSGYHAVVRAQGGALHVQDLNSTNGIYLENLANHRWQRVPAATLVNDMRIKFGRTVFQVEVNE